MLGKGVSRDHFHPQTCSRKNAPKTRQVKRNLKDVVYIDVDSDQVDDVVIIDYPEFVSKKLLGSSGPSRDRTSTPQSVISIDDDDEDVAVENPGNDDEVVGELDSDASSSKRFSYTSVHVQNSVHIYVDDCDVYEEDSVPRMQKSKEASISNQQNHKESSFAKAAGRNHYGIYASESESSDSDCSDCEVMEREQWEKVSVKRNRWVLNDRFFHEEHASSSGLHGNNCNGIGVENRAGQHKEGPVPCTKSKNCNFCNGVTDASRYKKELGREESKRWSLCQDACDNGVDKDDKYVKENQSSFTVKDDSQVDGVYCNLKTDYSFKDSCQKVEKENFTSPRFGSMEEMYFSHQYSDIEQGEKTVKENQSSFTVKDDSQVDGVYCNLKTDNSFKDSCQKVEKESFTSPRFGSMEEMYFSHQYSDIEQGEKTVKENQSSFTVKDDSQVDGVYCNLKTDNSFKDSCQKVEKESFTSPRFGSMEEMYFSHQYSDIEQGEKTVKENLSSFTFKDDSQVDGVYCNLKTDNSFKDSCQKVEKESFTSPRFGSMEEICFSHQYSDIEQGEKTVKQNQSFFTVKDDSQVDGVYCNLKTDNSFKDSCQKVEKESFTSPRFGSMEEICFSHQYSDIEQGEKTVKQNQLFFTVKDDSQVDGVYCNLKTDNSFKDSCRKVEKERFGSMEEMYFSHQYSDIEQGEKTVKGNQSSFTVKDDSQVGGVYCNLKADNSFKDSCQKVEKENFTSPRFRSMEEMYFSDQNSDIEQGEKTSKAKPVPCPKSKNCNFCNGVAGASRYKKELGREESKPSSLHHDACDNQVDKGENISEVKSNLASFVERHVNGDGFKLHTQVGDLTAPKESDFINDKESHKKTDECKDACDKRVDKDDNLSELNSNLASFDERQVNGDGFKLHTQDGDLTAPEERDLINEKEKHKETDEYKQAMEEEWASRQRQLLIQSEEARRLRKRKKAESIRLLDMQKRQKQRIEEVRETQKKDEEFNNMKDQLRVEIQKGLKELEIKCNDMTSMLQGLGIHVGGSSTPSPNEVHAAYKRAMLKFHPDRSSKSNLHEQVEAEEKFKLISRMKEKLLTK